jgi:multiple sugar transport system substrate-binding protein
MADLAYNAVRRMSRRRFLSATALAGVGVAGGGALLAGCGGGSGARPSGGGGEEGSGGLSGSMTWASWANPGEAERFREFTKQWGDKTGVQAKYQTVTGDYLAKLLTQLAGGSAPDAFYAGDDQMSKLIQSNNVLALDDFLASDKATVKFTDHYPGLTKWMQGEDGKTYGLPNDCNPIALWFNKNILNEAGVTTDPAAQQEAGTWTLDAFTDLLTKVKAATGTFGNVLESGWWGFWMGWITAQGGTMFDEDGKAVFDTDPKAQATLDWMFEQLRNGNMRYGGSLPRGQGVDALFYAGQLATMSYGRWVLPNLKKVKAKVDYDLAPLPSADGKSIPAVPVGTSSIAVNAKAKNPDAALAFVSDYTNAEGQKFRLSGGGNALPTLPGLEDIATEGNDPPHGGWFNDLAKAGWGTPKAIYSDPQVATKLPLKVNQLLLEDSVKTLTAKSFSEQIVQLLNGS